MKEAMGGTWLFGIVIFFIILFATIVSISLNWSRAYKIKDEIIREIEDNHGLNEKAVQNINEYIGDIGYKSSGDCQNDEYGVITGKNYIQCHSKCNYCVKKNEIVTRENNTASFTDVYSGTQSVDYCKTKDNGKLVSMGHPSSAYYSVRVFFKLEMPIISSIFGLEITGETATIYNISQGDKLGTPADC